MHENLENKSIYLLKPENFGPIYWNYFHTFLLTKGNDLNIIEIRSFIDQFIETIPCDECKEHARKIHKENPFDTDSYFSEYGAYIYSVMFHNEVNKLLGKAIY